LKPVISRRFSLNMREKSFVIA